MSFSLKDLNDVQNKAVTSINGPVLVLAGAGSGKTRTLTYRIAYLVKKMKVKPSQILAVTFTNKAAKEMKERIGKLLGSEIAPLWIGTFHGICARIIRAEAEELGYSKNFTIYDVDDQVRALKKVISSLGIPQQQLPPKLIQSRLSRIKNQFLYPEDIEKETLNGLESRLPEIYRHYQAYLKSNNAMDFDDLLMKPIELFNDKPEIGEKYSNKFKYVLIDEYQDTNRAQYLFIKKLIQKHKNLFVVGDEDQAIYGWRGADIQNILNFNKDFPEAEVFKLEENYRSFNNILQASNSVVKNNTQRLGKNLFSNKDDGEKIQLYAATREDDEAKHVVDIIHDEMYTNNHNFKDIAILYRTNAQSRIIEDVLRKNAISYNIVGGIKFYERKEIKDILAYLKLIANPADDVALKRIVNFPLRGIGETTISKIEKFAEMEKSTLFEALGKVKEIAAISPVMSNNVLGFYTLISKFIGLQKQLSAVELTSSLSSETGIEHHYQTEYDQYESENRMGNIKELFASIDAFCRERESEKRDSSLIAYVEDVSLMSEVDSWNSSANAVTLMTLHAAKGLEFPVVCITGLEMGLLPLQRSQSNLNELEEERRLLYVGMTRAEEKLYLSYAEKRLKYGTLTENLISMFLEEIPPDLLNTIYSTSGIQTKRSRKKTAKRKKTQTYFNAAASNDTNDFMYRVGQPVYHATFGQGQILSLEGSGDKMKITIHFQQDDIVKKLIKEYANLSPVEA